MEAKIDDRLQDLLSNNREFAQTWHNPFSMDQMRAMAKKSGVSMLILTCLDPRCIPETTLNTAFRAGMIRNAGGRATPDVVKSITSIRTLVDAKAVFVLHHTDCGLAHITDEEIVADAKKRTPGAGKEVDEMMQGEVRGFGCFREGEGGLEETVRRDVEWLRGRKVLEGVVIRGLVQDLETGLVRVLDCGEGSGEGKL